jgi:hypothetical protein
MSEADWSLGTFEGVRRDQARRAAAATPAQRIEWLEEILRLAMATGALQRERRLKQRAIDEAWYGAVPDS